MISSKALMWFLVRLALVESLLIAPWPCLEAVHRNVFSASGNVVIHGLFADRELKFCPVQSPEGLLDVEVTMIDPSTGRRGTMPISSRHYGWMPIAFAGALSLATAVSWKRRLVGALFVMLCAEAFVIVRVWIDIQVNFSDPDGHGVLKLSPPLRTLLASIDGALAVPMIGWYLVPLLIWMTWLLCCQWPSLAGEQSIRKSVGK